VPTLDGRAGKARPGMVPSTGQALEAIIPIQLFLYVVREERRGQGLAPGDLVPKLGPG